MNRRQFIQAMASAFGAAIAPGPGAVPLSATVEGLIEQPAALSLVFPGEGFLLTDLYVTGGAPREQFNFNPALYFRKEQLFGFDFVEGRILYTLSGVVYMDLYVGANVSRIGVGGFDYRKTISDLSPQYDPQIISCPVLRMIDIKG